MLEVSVSSLHMRSGELLRLSTALRIPQVEKPGELMLEVPKPFFQRRADRGRKKIVQITERHAPGIARRHFADLKGGAARQKVTDLLGRGAIG